VQRFPDLADAAAPNGEPYTSPSHLSQDKDIWSNFNEIWANLPLLHDNETEGVSHDMEGINTQSSNQWTSGSLGLDHNNSFTTASTEGSFLNGSLGRGPTDVFFTSEQRSDSLFDRTFTSESLDGNRAIPFTEAIEGPMAVDLDSLGTVRSRYGRACRSSRRSDMVRFDTYPPLTMVAPSPVPRPISLFHLLPDDSIRLNRRSHFCQITWWGKKCQSGHAVLLNALGQVERRVPAEFYSIQSRRVLDSFIQGAVTEYDGEFGVLPPDGK
jgi:hypothetical protein